MNNLALVESKTLREENISKIDALEKVKAIKYLNNDFIVSVEQVAEYYEADKEAINSIIRRNKDELISDGLRVLKGKELRLFKGYVQSDHNPDRGLLHDEPNLKFAPSFTIIPRRALLRIGMLLTESEIARKVRDYLLNSEDNSRFNPEKVEVALKSFNSIKKVLDEIGATAEAKLETAKEVFGKAGIEIPVNIEDVRKIKSQAAATRRGNRGNTKLYLNKKFFENVKKDHRWSTPDLAKYVGTSRVHMWSLLTWESAVGNTSYRKLVNSFPQYRDLMFVERKKGGR